MIDELDGDTAVEQPCGASLRAGSGLETKRSALGAYRSVVLVDYSSSQSHFVEIQGTKTR